MQIMENGNKEFHCLCNKEYDKKSFKEHYKNCSIFKQKFSKFDNTISLLLKEFSHDENELNLVIFMLKRYIKIISNEIKKIKNEKNKNYIKIGENDFYKNQYDNILNRNNNFQVNDELFVSKDRFKKGNFLLNYSQGQIKGDDENPAGLPNFQRKSNKEYLINHEKFVENQKKIFKSWRKDDERLQNLRIINIKKYNPLGFNLDLNNIELFINQLTINTVHENKYVILKIISKIAIFNYIIFLGEDKNKDIIPVSIYDADKYYSLNLDNWEQTQQFYNIGKYIIVINPYYIIYKDTMYETSGTDGLVCESPNETILFKDENDLNIFINLLKKNNFESLKELGDLMITRKCYEKSIYYYEKALNIKNDNNIIKSKIYSNLSENYIKYQYFTKGLEYINKSIDIIDDCLKQNIENKIDKNFIIKSHLRKLRCFIGLRKFKEAYTYLERIKDKNFKDFYKLDEKYINELLNINEIKSLINLVNKGYQNYLGKYNFEEMIKDEKKIFYLNNGDYINSKIEIDFDPLKGIKIIAKEDINKGEYIIAEKAIYCCRTHDPNNAFETSTKINTPLHLISQIEQIDILNNLIKILKKSPLDYKEFFILYNGDNLIENYNERLENLPENLLSIINIDLIEKICKYNKYTSIRNIYYTYKVSIGIWRYFSLFNHSCLPNTINFGIGDFVFVIANRLIKKGEEINILYLSTPKLYNINKNMLKNIYNFECNCLLCESEKKIREKYPDILSQYDDFIIRLREYNLD